MATTMTLPDNSVVTLPAYSDSADIGVITTDLTNIVNNINALSTGKASIRNSSVYIPEFSGLKINGGSGGDVDVIQWGGGLEYGSASNIGGIMFSHTSGRTYTFRGKGVNNGKNEDFLLPLHSDGTSNKTYHILTDKDFPFTRLFDTSPGGSSNSITFSAPENYRHCFIFMADTFFTLYHTDSTSTTIYKDHFPSSGWTLTKSGATYTLTRSATTAFRYTILWL